MADRPILRLAVSNGAPVPTRQKIIVDVAGGGYRVTIREAPAPDKLAGQFATYSGAWAEAQRLHRANGWTIVDEIGGDHDF